MKRKGRSFDGRSRERGITKIEEGTPEHYGLADRRQTSV